VSNAFDTVPTVECVRHKSNWPTDRHQAALEEFYETFPQAAEATFVTAETFEELIA
jgi:hypothetical protein